MSGHWAYVTAAYAATFVIMAALVLASVGQARRARRALDALEARRRGEES